MEISNLRTIINREANFSIEVRYETQTTQTGSN